MQSPVVTTGGGIGASVVATAVDTVFGLPTTLVGYGLFGAILAEGFSRQKVDGETRGKAVVRIAVFCGLASVLGATMAATGATIAAASAAKLGVTMSVDSLLHPSAIAIAFFSQFIPDGVAWVKARLAVKDVK